MPRDGRSYANSKHGRQQQGHRSDQVMIVAAGNYIESLKGNVLEKPWPAHTTLHGFDDKFFIHFLHLKSPSPPDTAPQRASNSHSVLIEDFFG